jgi:hypothetical protein
MAVIARNRRPSAIARRTGYFVAAMCGVVMLCLLNVWPGWQIVPFLSADFANVLGLINLSVGVGIALNMIYLIADPHRWKPAGDLVNTAVGLAVLVRFWRVFPFEFPAASIDWALVVRALLVLGAGGCVVGLAVQLAMLLRSLFQSGGDDR